MRVELGKLPGVSVREASYGRRSAVLALAPGNTVAVAAIYRGVRAAHALIPLEAEVLAEGLLEERGGELFLALESGDRLRLDGWSAAAGERERLRGGRVEVAGRLPRPPEEESAPARLALQVDRLRALPRP